MQERDELTQTFLHMFTDIPFNQMLGLKLVSLTEESATLSFPMKPTLIGNFMQGILHGGVISSVLDMAGGAIAMAHAALKHQHLSLEELNRCEKEPILNTLFPA